MQTIDEQFIPPSMSGGSGGILYDALRLRKPDATLFDPESWRARGALEQVAGGRGSVCFLAHEGEQWVLRHYRRGGLIASVSADRYVYTGAGRTRSLREWRLLAQLQRLGLPVPVPIAARYVRTALTYRADLITGRLPGDTLAAALVKRRLDIDEWHAIGATVGRFHREGVHHADLNAHNILLDAQRVVHFIDFDRGRIRARGSWESDVLSRLRRSLEKLRAANRYVQFGEGDWRAMMDGYGERRS